METVKSSNRLQQILIMTGLELFANLDDYRTIGTWQAASKVTLGLAC